MAKKRGRPKNTDICPKCNGTGNRGSMENPVTCECQAIIDPQQLWLIGVIAALVYYIFG